jgi:hypothetical protein
MRVLALALLLLAAPAGAATIVIDFEAEAVGEYDDGFVSAVCGCVRFSEWQGGELRIRERASDKTLVVGEEGGTLLLEFLVPVISVRLEFGGDSESSLVESKPAVLVGLSGGEFASIDAEMPNRNNTIDQTLQIAVPPNLGPPIDQALFSFVQLGEHEPLSPIVGRLTLVTVPEAGGLGLLALFLAFGSRRR